MLIPDQILTVKVKGNNRKYYEKKGYLINDSHKVCDSPIMWEIQVKLEDLQFGSATKVLRECNRCGKIEKIPYNWKHFDFCRSCGNKGRKSNEETIFTCTQCGKETYISRISYGKCCKCRSIRYPKPNPEVNINEYIKSHCKICGSEYNTSIHDKIEIHNVCKKCWNDYRWVRDARGSKPNLNSKRNTDLYKRYVDKHGLCDICGSQHNLEAHHKYSVKDFPEYIVNEEFMVVLCKTCHTAFHRLCGRKMNVPEQYDKFKERYKGDVNE